VRGDAVSGVEQAPPPSSGSRRVTGAGGRRTALRGSVRPAAFTSVAASGAGTCMVQPQLGALRWEPVAGTALAGAVGSQQQCPVLPIAGQNLAAAGPSTGFRSACAMRLTLPQASAHAGAAATEKTAARRSVRARQSLLWRSVRMNEGKGGSAPSALLYPPGVIMSLSTFTPRGRIQPSFTPRRRRSGSDQTRKALQTRYRKLRTGATGAESVTPAAAFPSGALPRRSAPP
jgi:hypothetical protein